MDGGQILAIKLAAGTEWSSCMSSPTNPPHSFTLCSSNVMQARPYKYEGNLLIFSDGLILTDCHSFLEYKEKAAVQSLHPKLILKRPFSLTIYPRKVELTLFVQLCALDFFLLLLFCFVSIFQIFRLSR